MKKQKLDQLEETCLINGLKELHKILKSILTSEEKTDCKIEKLKCLWIISKFGKSYDNYYELNNDIFKGYAWSTYRGSRVFNQMKPYGILADYQSCSTDCDVPQTIIKLKFKNETAEIAIVYALDNYVNILLDNYDNDEAYKLFKKGDMRVYMD